MNWITGFDVAVEPTFDHYLPGGRRPPLGRCRTAVRRGLVAGIAIVFIALGIAGTVAGMGLAGGIVGAGGLYILAALWFLPGLRWGRHTAWFLQPGMWVPSPATLKNAEKSGEIRFTGSIQVTQITAVFRFRGEERFVWVGCASGECREFRPGKRLAVFALTDPLARFRAPKPAPPLFQELEPVVRALLHMLRNDLAGLSEDECAAGLGGSAGWPDELVQRAMDAAQRLGMTGRRGRQRILTDAGAVWLLQRERERGIELIPEAQERQSVNSFTNYGGNMQFGNNPQISCTGYGGTASNIHNSNAGTSEQELDALRQLLEVLRKPEVRRELNDDQRSAVDGEVEVIAKVVEQNAPMTDKVCTSVKLLLGLAGELIIGAAGNGLYDALKQMF
ncbi:hypothetical protein [Amycolatopsis ultiminotia]|uniref:hypothetical protein n=1 Tax=Amycolatopsis ultiminotia TaxID=543629 RepID=UPI0031F19E30